MKYMFLVAKTTNSKSLVNYKPFNGIIKVVLMFQYEETQAKSNSLCYLEQWQSSITLDNFKENI